MPTAWQGCPVSISCPDPTATDVHTAESNLQDEVSSTIVQVIGMNLNAIYGAAPLKSQTTCEGAAGAAVTAKALFLRRRRANTHTTGSTPVTATNSQYGTR
jgi:hypothetical protein